MASVGLDLLNPQSTIILPNHQNNSYPVGLEQSIWQMCGTRNVIIRNVKSVVEPSLESTIGLDLVSGYSHGYVFVFTGYYTIGSTTFILVDVETYDNYFHQSHACEMMSDVSPDDVGAFLAARYPRNDRGLSICLKLRGIMREIYFGKGRYFIFNRSPSSIISRLRAKSFSNIIKNLNFVYPVHLEVIETLTYGADQKCEICLETKMCSSLCGHCLDDENSVNGHYVCETCSIRWLQSQLTCPHCRRVVRPLLTYTFPPQESYADLLMALCMFEKYNVVGGDYSPAFSSHLNDLSNKYFGIAFEPLCTDIMSKRNNLSNESFDFSYRGMSDHYRKFEIDLAWYWFKFSMFDSTFMNFVKKYHSQHFIRYRANFSTEMVNHLLSSRGEVCSYIDPRSGLLDQVSGVIQVAMFESFSDGKMYSFRLENGFDLSDRYQNYGRVSLYDMANSQIVDSQALASSIIRMCRETFNGRRALSSYVGSPLDFLSMMINTHGDDVLAVLTHSDFPVEVENAQDVPTLDFDLDEDSQADSVS